MTILLEIAPTGTASSLRMPSSLRLASMGLVLHALTHLLPDAAEAVDTGSMANTITSASANAKNLFVFFTRQTSY